jgi:hypothetical protein
MFHLRLTQRQYKEYYLLRCSIVQSSRSPLNFRRVLLPPASELKCVLITFGSTDGSSRNLVETLFRWLTSYLFICCHAYLSFIILVISCRSYDVLTEEQCYRCLFQGPKFFSDSEPINIATCVKVLFVKCKTKRWSRNEYIKKVKLSLCLTN